MKTGAERQRALKESKLAAGHKLSNVWLPEGILIDLRVRFPGPKGGVDWEAVTRAALETKESVPVKPTCSSELGQVSPTPLPVISHSKTQNAPAPIPSIKEPHGARRVSRDEMGDSWRIEALARMGIDFKTEWLKARTNEARRMMLGVARKRVPWTINLVMILRAFEMGHKRPEKPEGFF